MKILTVFILLIPSISLAQEPNKDTTYIGNMDALITAIKGISSVAGSTGPAGAAGATGPTGGSTVSGSTQTFSFKVGSAMLSTSSVCGIPNACHSWGSSTVTIVGMWADAYSGSTVGWTKIDILISTGGVNGLPLGANRFNPLSLSTASSSGVAAYSGFITTTAVINPYEWVGVGISSMAVSGQITQGLEIHLDYWERGRY